MAEEHVQRRLAAILAADVVGYSHLIEQDETGTLTALRARWRDIVNPLIAQHHSSLLPDTRRIFLRIGINVGDVIVEGTDLYGDGVNVAARLEGLAEPGGICLSRNVYDHVKRELDFGYDELGPQAVKNIAEPLHVYRVRSRL